jgi:ribosomal protein S27E
MNVSGKTINPVKPSALELVFMYRCPHCDNENTLLAPTRPGLVRCNVCRRDFAIIPVEERTISFIKLILANGTSAIDQDFM